MSPSSCKSISDICDELRALRDSIKALPTTVDRSAAQGIKELIRSGEGVLPELRKRIGVTGKATDLRANDDNDEDGDTSNGVDAPTDGPELPPTDFDEDDPHKMGKINEMEALQYLSDLQPEIDTRYNLPPMQPPASLLPSVTPFAHQLRAVALCRRSEKTPLKGMILADKPGLGKTLSFLMTAIGDRQPGDGPTIIVVPPSCARQWMEEIKANFGEGTIPTMLLNDSTVSPFDLYKFQIIVVTYNQVVSEYRRLAEFEKNMELYQKGRNIVPPKRPMLTLLSGVWKMDGVRPLGRYLGLDEAHAIKNPNGRAYAAIKMLRNRIDTCISITATPLDNTWADVFALVSLFSGHPFTSMLRMRQIFTDAYKPGQKKQKYLCVPRLHWLLRLVQFMHGMALSRPSKVITDNLPTKRTKVVEFDLPRHELELSNKEYKDYKKTLGGRDHGDKTYGGGKKKEDSMIKWSALTKAQQYAFHPRLVDIMELERKWLKAQANDEGSLDAVHLTEEEEAKRAAWLEDLKVGENSRSARVDVIIDLVNRHRDQSPGDAILIVDESVFFLDILAVALEHVMYDPVQVFRYDGRSNPAERHITLQAFSKGTGTRIMLATRGTGGQGLNLQCANFLIRCGPLWKSSWEEQVDGRIYRPGQVKEVEIVEVSARKCQVETYKRGVRGRKNNTNVAVWNLVEMDDGQLPPAWNGK